MSPKPENRLTGRDVVSLRCLVTGGAGFIGSHVVEALLAAGHEVAVIDDLSTGKRDNLPSGVPLYEIDICEPADAAFEQFRPDVLVHHAAQISVGVSMHEPLEDARINILGSIRLLRTALGHGVRKVVYASSAAAYGPLAELPLVETQRALPVSAYGASKYTVEHYLKTAQHHWGLEQWAALRYSNVYGPRQDPHGEAGVVAIFCNALLRGESPCIFDDGELTRDYVFVEDVARANVRAVETDLTGHPDPVFNVSTGQETTVNSLFRALQGAFGVDTPARPAPPRPGDVRRSRLDPSKAQRELAWQARVPFAEGIQATAAFFRSPER